MTMMDEPFVPEGGSLPAATTDNFTDFMTKGGVPPVVAEVTGLLGDPFAAEDGAKQPQGKGANWLLGDDMFAAEGEQPEDQQEAPEDEDPELTKFLAAGGKAKDYYFQQFQNQPKEEVAAPAEQPQATDAFKAELEAIESQREELVEKMADNYAALQHAQNRGDEASYRALLKERSRMDIASNQLNQKESFVNERQGQAVQQTLSTQYQDTFVNRIKEDHGITDPKMLDKMRGRVLETPYIAELIKNPQTAGLMSIPLVQDIMTKAALYDMQYSKKTQGRRAPADPGATQGTNPRTPPKPAPTPATPYGNDAEFNDFMTKGRPKK